MPWLVGVNPQMKAKVFKSSHSDILGAWMVINSVIVTNQSHQAKLCQFTAHHLHLSIPTLQCSAYIYFFWEQVTVGLTSA